MSQSQHPGDPPQVSLVVSTVGRPDALARLLASVSNVSTVSMEVIIVDQHPDATSAEVADRSWRHPVVYTGSSRGLSHGRNVGMRLARGDILCFPDDEAWYPDGSIEAATDFLASNSGVDILCGQQVDEGGRASLLRFASTARRVHRFNLARTVVSSSLFFRRSAVDAVGEFDEQLGAGSAGWWWAGEETDFVLRALDLGLSVSYQPNIQVGHPALKVVVNDAARRKQLAYSCAAGELYRRHHFPAWYVAWLITRRSAKVAGLCVRGRRSEAALMAQRISGLLAGWRGRPPSGWETSR
jgi:glycosyltransferase involved in cell wall biosynthesis